MPEGYLSDNEGVDEDRPSNKASFATNSSKRLAIRKIVLGPFFGDTEESDALKPFETHLFFSKYRLDFIYLSKWSFIHYFIFRFQVTLRKVTIHFIKSQLPERQLLLQCRHRPPPHLAQHIQNPNLQTSIEML